MKRLIGSLLLISLSSILTLSGCGGSGGSTQPPPTTTSVVVSPSSASVISGATQQFTVTVTGTSSTAVTWSVTGCQGTACGSVNATGLYTAPTLIATETTINVVATLQSDTSKTSSATVSLTPVSVRMTENTVSLSGGQTHQFSATVSGHSNTALEWSITGCSSACGSISATGLYTAPAVITAAATIAVVATSVADNTKTATATVQYIPSVVVLSVSPATVSLISGGTQQFTASVDGSSSTAVNWSISGCSGSNCGTINATGLYRAPTLIATEATINVVATLQSDTGKTSSAIVSLTPVSVRMTEDTVKEIWGGKTHQFTAIVSGHSNTTVLWSITGCSSACGSISTTGLYTAPAVNPAAATINVVATSVADNMKTAAATVELVPVSVKLPDSEYGLGFGAKQTHQFIADVHGTSNTALTWSLAQCSATDCGTITPGGLYTAPSFIPTVIPVVVVATSVADPTKFDGAALYLQPVDFYIDFPGDLQVPVNATKRFSATVSNDASNSGVIWSLGAGCTPTTCGTLSDVTSTSVTYTAPSSVPSPATVQLTAKAVADPAATRTLTITIIAQHLLTPGDYAFYFSGWEQANCTGVPQRRVVVGRFYVQDDGTITNGLEDINAAGAVSKSLAFTGTYMLNPNRQGNLVFNTSDSSTMYTIAVDPSGTKGNLIFWAVPYACISGTGHFEAQDKAALTQASLAGQYAVGLSSSSNDTFSTSAIGRFTVDGSGALTGGKMDMMLPSSDYNNMTLTGSLGAPSSSTGRGTASLSVSPLPGAYLGTMQFAYYIVSSNKVLMMQTDERGTSVPVLAGDFQRQTTTYSTAKFNAPVIFRLEGADALVQSAVIGKMSPTGSGSLTGILDQNLASNITLNHSFSGTFNVDSSGRMTMSLPGGSAFAYLFGQNQAYLAQTLGSTVMFGSLKPQTSGPFSAATLDQTLRIGEPDPPSPFAECDAGSITFDGAGSISGKYDYDFFTTSGGSNYHYTLNPDNSFNASYTLAANGRGQITLGGSPIVFWTIGPDEAVGLDTSSNADSLPVLLHMEK